MSLLVETLNRIVAFLESSHPIMIGIARSLQPGLSYEEITSKLEDFSYLLPTELIELYQWRNGQAGAYPDEFLPYYRLLSLEDALKEYKCQIELAKEFSEDDLPWQKLYDPCWLPIFKEDSNFYVISMSLKPQKHSPILGSPKDVRIDRTTLLQLFDVN
ncbi:MAG: SMI1/KNR4 family protein [Stenomitos frigidus ULC029]